MDLKSLQEFELAFPNNDIDGDPVEAGAKVYAPNLDMVRAGQFLSEKSYKALSKPAPKPKATAKPKAAPKKKDK